MSSSHSPATASDLPPPVAEWHRIVRDRDANALGAWLAEEVVFHSPVVHTPQRGRAITTLYLGAALQVFVNPSFRYVREIVGPRDAALEFEVELDGIVVNGIDLLRWNDAGRIVEFKVLIRPLQAIQLIHQMMGALLARKG